MGQTTFRTGKQNKLIAPIGRENLLLDVKESLSRDIPLLLHSSSGFGKTHLLKHLSREKGYLYFPSPSPLKELFYILCYQSSKKDKLSKNSLNTRQWAEKVFSFKKKQKPILLIDNLDQLKKSEIEIFLPLFEHYVLLCAADNLPSRLQPIWWKFQKINVPPLENAAMQQLLASACRGLPIKNYPFLENKIIHCAGGSPLAALEMVNSLKNLKEITDEDIRKIHHEAGVRYVETKNFILVLWFAALTYRFVALGTHSFENYILAGFFTAGVMVLRIVLRRT